MKSYVSIPVFLQSRVVCSLQKDERIINHIVVLWGVMNKFFLKSDLFFIRTVLIHF